MTIPVLYTGPRFEKNRKITDASILDIAPTVAALVGVPCAPEWEGTARA